VEIWSDVICPWCYIGKARFEEALAGFEHRDEVEVIYRSFELDPGRDSVEPVGQMLRWATPSTSTACCTWPAPRAWNTS
jgi:predicted DsbA family dithiol-disulfide isomerase